MPAPICPSTVRIGPFVIDVASGDVRNGGRTSRLQPQTIAVLLTLLERPGQLVTREELRAKLWPDTAVDFEDGLNHAIARLREALHDSAHAPRYIETIPRRGYRFVGELPTEAFSPPRPDGAPRSAGRPSFWHRVAVVTAVALIVAIAGVGTWWRAPQKGIGSLAVLPLANLSHDPAQEHVADGITEELITEIARLNVVRVVSRTSTAQYRGTKKTLPAIAQELGVDALIEGSVQRSGDRVRVAVQLVRADTDDHVWAESFDLPLGDLLALRTQLAASIVGQVRRRVGGRGVAPQTVSPIAYEAYLLGWSFARQNTREGYLKSIEYFEHAIAAAPDYALAHALLAESHAMLDFLDDVRGEHFKRARALAERAIILAPHLAEAQLRLADLKFYWDWDWDQCETGFRRARDLNPGSADAREHYAVCLYQLGRYDDALRELESTLELDPLSVRNHVRRAEILLRSGRAAEAAESFRKAADLSPSNAELLMSLGDALMAAKRGADAVAALAKANALRNDSPEMTTALHDALRRGGELALMEEVREQRRAILLRRIASLHAAASRGRVSPLRFANAYAGLGDSDKAFQYLEAAFRERCPGLAHIKANRSFELLRLDPRYRAMLRKMGLPEEG